jgi:acyl carrier protein
MDIQEQIYDELRNLLAEKGVRLAAPLSGETALLETGLDSLGFAVLVVRLEDRLGYDPFMLMAEAVYPRTLAEFVSLYEAHRHHAA